MFPIHTKREIVHFHKTEKKSKHQASKRGFHHEVNPTFKSKNVIGMSPAAFRRLTKRGQIKK